MKTKLLVIGLLFLGIAGCQENTKSPEIPSGSSAIDPATYAQTTKIPEGILTPDQVETSIGMLKFF
jgi:hypothetical protein